MKILLLIAFSFATFAISAQDAGYPPPSSNEANMPDVYGARYFHFGLNFTPGIYWSTPNTSNNTANGASFGYGYGANLEFYFTRNYGILTGFEVTQIEAKYINTSSYTRSNLQNVDSTITHDESIQYLQIPFELKLKTSPFGKLRYYGLVGLDFGFRLKATDDYNTQVTPNFFNMGLGSLNTYSGNNADISSQTDFFRATFVIGGGVEYTLAGSTALQASLTYNNCFTNLNSSSSNSVKVKGLELMIGILF